MSKDKQFYADDFYRNEKGEYYTGENLEHNKWLKSHYTFTKVENPYEEMQGKTVTCNYSQIFYPNSALLLCNEIVNVDEYLYDNIENGDFWTYYDKDGEECEEEDSVEQREAEIFQYYLIDNATKERLCRSTDELIFYCEKLDLYVLGVTHWGTGWDYVDMEFVY